MTRMTETNPSLWYAPADVRRVERLDGGFELYSPLPLDTYLSTLPELLYHWAEADPTRLFLAERETAGSWRQLTYGEAERQSDLIARALCNRALDGERPVMALSGNSIDHALLMLACFRAAIPFVPVSPAYALMSKDYEKLKYIDDLVRPALIYVQSSAPFAPALQAVGARDEKILTSELKTTLNISQLIDEGMKLPAVQSRQQVTGDTLAKILFTSGSTGLPKGVINTHRMLCANQQMIRQLWPFLENQPPVLLDWLPWNHTFGGNHNFNMVLRNGGTLYIDAGKPAPGLIDQTLRNLREISPTIYFNVPAGYAALLPFLENDADLAASFFKNLELIFYAAAALPEDSWRRLEGLALRHRGARIPMTSAWGSTETSPLATSAHFSLDGPGVIGLPAPGVRLKFVPAADKFEMRVKGVTVTPGYYKRPDLTEAAFDEEGYYRIGDAGRLADPADPSKGIIFDGRIQEDFKLSTGTWVHTGALRIALLSACAPLLQDAVICGHDRDRIGVLAWLNQAACADISGAALRARLQAKLHSYNQGQSGSSTAIAALLLMQEPPSIDANEITDKGYINQRAVLERRQALVERLFSESGDPETIRL